MKRDFISLNDYSTKEILDLLKLAKALKKTKGVSKNELQGKSIGLVFQKPSNRTRVSFEVGIYKLGGNCIYLSPREIDLGVRESTSDVARTLARYLDGIVARTNDHRDILELAKFANIPVINALSDLEHPCQAMADIQTIMESFPNQKQVTVSFVGDGNNNVCHSLMLACAKVGFNVKVASPNHYQPNPEITKSVIKVAKENKSDVWVGTDIKEAVTNSDVIYADTFVSMGQENESKKRLHDLKDYQVNDSLTKLANKNFIFMHCLPAHRGQEVTDEVMDGRHSIIFDQAENRMYVQQAIMIKLCGGKK